MIADEHKAFIQVYWKEPILKHGMDALTKKSSFANGWSLLGACFPNLIDYCGIVDFFFLKINTVEFVFILREEKDTFHQALYDFGLEGGLRKRSNISLFNNVYLII